MSNYHPSAATILTDLRTTYPDSPFLALGQTIWWDEPMKAVLLRALEHLSLGGGLVGGVHDTDYFAKLQVRQTGNSRFEMMAHNDGDTRDLWSAAGEISSLFGSETYPTKQDLNRFHVPIGRLARSIGLERLEYLSQSTAAYGWRGLVYTGGRDLIVNSLSLKEVGESVVKLLQWGFEGTRNSLADGCCQDEAAAIGHDLIGKVQAFCQDNPLRTLSDLYQYLLPNLFELLAPNLTSLSEVSSTSKLLRFALDTVHLPRFKIVDLFLREETRQLAASAYNEAVSGSEIYSLDKFGLGALPFDLIVPGKGRGTLRVTLRAIHIETPDPIRLPLLKPIKNAAELAERLSSEFGQNVILVGKAVTLISMLGAEFIFVFNEEGSGYVTRTRRLNQLLAKGGHHLEIRPILRVKYSTWDSLSVGHASFKLPEHLATTFGQPMVSSAEFADQWRDVVSTQQTILTKLQSTLKPRDLMAYLSESNSDWVSRIEEYERLKRDQVTLWDEAQAIQFKVDRLYADLHQSRQETAQLQRERGDHFRSIQEWTAEELSKREKSESKFIEAVDSSRKIVAQIISFKAKRWAIERGEQAIQFREKLSKIEIQADMVRQELVTTAILTITSLEHTNHRPTAWWLPMVDRSGNWFNRVAETTEFYLQPMQ